MHTPESLKTAIQAASDGKSKCGEEFVEFFKNDSLTGPCTRHLLNNLLSTNEETYLEIGMYHGASMASALYGNRVRCAYGLDMLHPGHEDKMRSDIIGAIDKFHKPSNGRVVVHFEDAFTFEVQRIPDPVTVYFYDADHTKNGHCKGITHFWPVLDKTFVLLVDDWKWEDVRTGTDCGLNQVGAIRIYSEVLWEQSKYYNQLFVGLFQKP